MQFEKIDALCTAFCSAGTKEMEKITGFGMRNIPTLPSLGWKYFNGLRAESDYSIYTFKEKYKRWFVKQSIKGVRRTAFNHYYKSKVAE